VSPYFVPGAQGVEQFAALARKGVKVTVLTNSLEATDVAAVHAGYARRRKALLAAGIELLEMKRAPSAAARSESRFGSSSGSSLHAKTFSVDRSVVFVGSFNFDPRSSQLNTELGFVIESPAMASAASDAILGRLAADAYSVRLDPDGELQWVEQVGGRDVVHDREPGAGFLRQLGVSVLSLLPIEWLL
jgi:putative cardiolipin synthase